MSEFPDLSTWLKSQTDTFEVKKKLLFSSIIHKATGEKVIEGFRYFTNSIDDVVAAFETGDIANLQKLDYAIDEDGDVDTSSVCILLAYTKSGAFFAAQPEQYQDYVPTKVREARYVTATLEQMEELDQTK